MKLRFSNLLLLCLTLIGNFHNCFSQEEINNLESKLLLGKVKSIKAVSYDAVEKFGELQKGKTTGIIITEFNSQGYLIKETSYDEKNKITYVTKYTYDLKNNLIEKSTPQIGILLINKYDLENKCIQTDELKNDKSLKFRTKNKFSIDGKLIEANTYNSKGAFYKKSLYKYDEKGNLIDISWYNKDGTLSFKVLKDYDERGNIIKEDNLIDILGERGSTMTFTYNNQSKVIETHFTSNDGMEYNRTTDYDEFGNIVSENSSSYSPLNQFTINYSYTYDNIGNWIARTEISKGPFEKLTIIKREIVYY